MVYQISSTQEIIGTRMPTFILGAGFNVNAAEEAGPVIGESSYDRRFRIACPYPLVGDTLTLCFEMHSIPNGKSIEDLFSEWIERKDYSPLDRLLDRLRDADHFIAKPIAFEDRSNCYRRFFTTFAHSDFLTFNYDALAETVLYRLGYWFPHDGYGVPVRAIPNSLAPVEFPDQESSAHVLHLHGSRYIRTSEWVAPALQRGQTTAWMSLRNEPLYTFDPSDIAANFRSSFRGVNGGPDFNERIIAPVPNKSDGLKQQRFIRDTYAKAEAALRGSDIVVAIGYSFNSHDRASYRSLLTALGGTRDRKLLIVSPEAVTIAKAIRLEFPNLSVQPLDATFKQWVCASFPGMKMTG
jgi:hypothetical protein